MPRADRYWMSSRLGGDERGLPFPARLGAPGCGLGQRHFGRSSTDKPLRWRFPKDTILHHREGNRSVPRQRPKISLMFQAITAGGMRKSISRAGCPAAFGRRRKAPASPI
jgi:hypothetical protein